MARDAGGQAVKRKRYFKVTKLVLYKHVPRIIREMRIHGDRREPTTAEVNGGGDVCYRLFCDESIRLIAKQLRKRPQDVFDALDTAMSASLDDLKPFESKEQP